MLTLELGIRRSGRGRESSRLLPKYYSDYIPTTAEEAKHEKPF
jgi:hypothetical protein